MESLLRPPRAVPNFLVVPVRTKRRLFVPEWARELPHEEKEKRLQSLIRTLPEERMERTFYLACTGGSLLWSLLKGTTKAE